MSKKDEIEIRLLNHPENSSDQDQILENGESEENKILPQASLETGLETRSFSVGVISTAHHQTPLPRRSLQDYTLDISEPNKHSKSLVKETIITPTSMVLDARPLKFFETKNTEKDDMPIKMYKQRNEDRRGSNDSESSESLETTDTYGQMEFINPNQRTRAYYVRCSDQTDMKSVQDILFKKMALEEWPKILISVVGAKSPFFIEENLKKQLKRDLLELCSKVGQMKKETWFITGAVDDGVIRLIAKAVEGYKHAHTSVIGITNWGVVYMRETLKQDKTKINYPKYPIYKERHKLKRDKKSYYYLNKDHTHFFLVDTGQEGTFGKKEIQFRHQFENYIVQQQRLQLRDKEKEKKTKKRYLSPAVQLVMNGGITTLEHIKKTLYPQDEDQPVMPIIVVAGSGRVADWIVQACDMEETKNYDNVPVLVSAIRNELGSVDVDRVYHDIKKIAKEKRNFIIRYGLGDKLEEKILYSFLSEKGSWDNLKHLTLEQYKLILLWDHLEIAEQALYQLIYDSAFWFCSQLLLQSPELRTFAGLEIPDLSPEKKEEYLEDLLIKALNHQKIKFLELIFKIGYDMSTITTKTLWYLYNKVLKSTKMKHTNGLEKMLNDAGFDSQKQVEATVYENIFQNKSRTLLSAVSNTINRLSSINLVDYEGDNSGNNNNNINNINKENPHDGSVNKKLDDPFKDLFLWAVMCNKHDVAKALWKRGENPIAKALIARKLYLRIAERYQMSYSEENLYTSLKLHASEFEKMSIDLLVLCSSERSKAQGLIKQDLPNYGDRKIIHLAALSHFEKFISLQPCIDYMNSKWYGAIQVIEGEFVNLKVVLGIFLLPSIFLFMRFKKDSMHDSDCCRRICNTEEPKASNFMTMLKCGLRTAYDKLSLFFSAPITKFWTNTIMYVCFLIVFIYVMLFMNNEEHWNINCDGYSTKDTTNTTDEKESNNTSENNSSKGDFDSYFKYLLLVFIISYFLEEIRQLFRQDGISNRQKIFNWWSSHWNKLESIALVLFMVAFVMELLGQEECGSAWRFSRFFLSIDFFLWVLKLLQLFSMNKKIGIYVAMLQKMLIDIGYFLVILSVLVMAYSVPRYFILYQEKLELSIGQKVLRKLFMVPFFQFFGELFLETPENAKEENKTVFGTNPTMNGNTDNESFVMWFTFLYMLLSTLLLINLVIAVFNNTYTELQRNANNIWHWQNYNLVNECQKKSFMPSPFSIFSHIKVFAMYLWTARRQKMAEEEKKDIPILEYFQRYTTLYKLLQFENEKQANYLQQDDDKMYKPNKEYEENNIKIRVRRPTLVSLEVPV